MRRATTAASNRSPRCLGYSVPRLGSPTEWPARPTRCMPREHRTRRLDLDHEVDSAHVDAQLERTGGDDAAQHTALQLVFDHHPLLARQRAVVGLHQFIAGQFVEVGRQPFGLAPGVAEDDGAAVGQDLGEHRRVHALPDVAHLLDRDDDVDLHLLADPRIDDGDRAPGAIGAVTTEEVGDLFQRALGCRETDPLRRADRDGLQPFERQHEMRAAFGGGHGMDLVDDDGVDVDEGVGDRRREHEVQALGRGDQQVDGVADQRLAFALRGVAGAHGHGGLMKRHTEPFGRQFDAHQRRAQVLLDVEGQGSQRRDVQHASAPLRVCRLGRAQPVDRCQEGGQRLAAARRCAHQGVAAGQDRRPAVDLRRGRRGKRRREPGPNGGRERLEHRVVSHCVRLRRGCDTGKCAGSMRDVRIEPAHLPNSGREVGRRAGLASRNTPIELNDP